MKENGSVAPKNEREKIPHPSVASLEMMRGEVGPEKEVVLSDGEKKFVRLVEKGGGLLGVKDKEEWAGILNHSLLVRRIATHLGQELKAAGQDVNLETISEASLLHDVGRRSEDEEEQYREWQGPVEDHTRKGARMLKEAGFSPEITDTIASHHFPTRMKDVDTLEKKLLFYADRRVSQDIVSLEKRVNNDSERWVAEGMIGQEDMVKSCELASQVEREIFAQLDIEPEDLQNLPMPKIEKYLRSWIERNLEDRVIKYFRGLQKES